MKKFIATIISTLTVAGIISIATAGATASYCGTSSYDLHYRAIFQYPSGTYWVNQINHYPAYYAANNAYYLAKYGC